MDVKTTGMILIWIPFASVQNLKEVSFEHTSAPGCSYHEKVFFFSQL
jgi:hypothetical protein